MRLRKRQGNPALAHRRETVLNGSWDSPPVRPEIFAPFAKHLNSPGKSLFQPFDLGKWLVIGFAAWLATFLNGFGFNYGYDFNKRGRFSHWLHTGHIHSLHDIPARVYPLHHCRSSIFLFALAVLLLWLNARARFIFTDCIVRNRGAIVEPWHEYHEEGNSYFIPKSYRCLCSFLIFGGLGLLFLASWYWHHPLLPLAVLILIAVILGLAAAVVGLVLKLIVPVMYRQRCGAAHAFLQVWNLVLDRPGLFILYVLFYLVLLIAAAMIGCIATCVTCCAAMLPYIGTVILLPVVMVLFAFPLCFLRQFGEQYDVWAGVTLAQLPSPPPIPPIQETSPSV